MNKNIKKFNKSFIIGFGVQPQSTDKYLINFFEIYLKIV